MTTYKRRKRARRVAEAPPPAARLLLDTQVWLWWQTDDRRLGPRTRAAIRAAGEVRLSAASVWEIAIKSSLGKLAVRGEFDVEAELEQDGFRSLAIELFHAAAVRALPRIHRDPFDRLLVAQSRLEGLTFVTADATLRRYEVPVLDATL